MTIPYLNLDVLQPADEVIDETRLSQGVDVYLTNYCGACHTLDVAETVGVFGPVHNDMATLAEAHLASTGYTGDATTVEEYIHESIVSPALYLVPEYIASSHAMPAFTTLSDDDLAALVYLLSQQRLD